MYIESEELKSYLENKGIATEQIDEYIEEKNKPVILNDKEYEMALNDIPDKNKLQALISAIHCDFKELIMRKPTVWSTYRLVAFNTNKGVYMVLSEDEQEKIWLDAAHGYWSEAWKDDCWRDDILNCDCIKPVDTRQGLLKIDIKPYADFLKEKENGLAGWLSCDENEIIQDDYYIYKIED